jgi:hypothetical protein
VELGVRDEREVEVLMSWVGLGFDRVIIILIFFLTKFDPIRLNLD